MNLTAEPIHTATACAHCGDDCPAEPIRLRGKAFCCQGCKAVYELLDASNLCQYYALDEHPGQKIQPVELPGRFDYLDADSVQAQLLSFRSAELARLTLHLPQMHCASCIYLLERLYQLNPGVTDSRVNFLRKEISLSYRPADTSLKEVVKLLAALGYEPQITLAELGAQPNHGNRRIYYQLGLAGFCFGNVMLLAFPDYLSFTDELAAKFGHFFGYLSLLLALPVLLYGAQGFYRSAWAGLRQRTINLDFPISLGLTSLFSVSTYEVLSHSGAGYFDSFTGLVFFMLIGKWVQQRTYDALRFDRDFTSYFPVAVTLLTAEGEKSVSVKDLQVGQRIRVRNQEVIPADAMLMRGAGQIDYSFVTGESVPVAKVAGEVVYAGGRQVGEAVELEVVREVSQGYLTQLWNNPAFQKADAQTLETYANRVGRYFVAATLLIAAGAILYWYPRDEQMMWRAFTSVLVIACPCALSLATPFALGSALAVFGRHKFFLKNSGVAETLGRATTIVFDKTGTLTDVQRSAVEYCGPVLTEREQQAVAAVVAQSTHPLSQRLAQQLPSAALPVANFVEVPGQGLRGVVGGVTVKVGSAAFVGIDTAEPSAAGADPSLAPAQGVNLAQSAGAPEATLAASATTDKLQSRVYVSLADDLQGCFVFRNVYRQQLGPVLADLGRRYRLAVLSGDNDTEQDRLRQLFGPAAELRFRQTPQQKLDYVAELKQRGETVIMVGDGLNDAGALQQADAGVALTDTLTNFSPACDAILDAGSFGRLSTFLAFTRDCLQVVLATFVLSFVYNGLGLGLAVQGKFTPIVSAILMPISSLSVMVFATLLVRYAAHRRHL
ncbi:heavy metal translocating P-type ATPase metal-binding domain-containing protein [Hymenobacter sp. 15J16-1T3B]|uniref:heavy metal translocating P-type ATPase n=1 Tax=Hymenobacter sp. 15J16-1T3B TaxID=2886941 RepID=UPI001D0F6726|nr:heavy metal translocating P-type ATPase metal-binding domain-containing protein [Hymenobacter sp. 15J16-1T3B]MCC3159165.1 heavy metal translocating P-type ATPase metal-binding domain-containing protein [Hymenobacter sp. 15J16-1T3B]